jgi:hypothetical protein
LRGNKEIFQVKDDKENCMANQDIAHQRLFNQRLSRPDFESPADVVRWFGAVQAQDFLSSLYAIGLRMPAATEESVELAVAEKTIVRSWPMRGTIHFMPAEDVQWMVRLLARRQNIKLAGMFRRAGLAPDIFERAGEVFVKSLQGGKQLMRKQLYEALSVAGIEVQGELSNGHLLGYWAGEGVICLGSRQGKQQTFALLDDWVPKHRVLEGEEALATLARRYFRSHGPATLYDFAWWTGLTIAEARQGIELVEQHFVSETVNGQIYWFSPASEPVSHSSSVAYLLPNYDEFTVAYKDRSAFLDPTRSREEALYGIGHSVIIDGRMVGTWKRTLKKDTVVVTINPFSKLSEEQQAAVVKAAQSYAHFLNLSVIVGW